MKAPINSRKHIVQLPFDQIATGTAQVNNLITAVDRTIADSATEVQEGAIVKAVFIEMWLQNSAADGHAVLTVSKNPAGDTGPAFGGLADLDSYDNKKNILFTHEGLTSNDGVGNPVRILYHWIKIPKGKQRFGLGDRLDLNLSNPSSNNLNRCGLAIYKEYT